MKEFFSEKKISGFIFSLFFCLYIIVVFIGQSIVLLFAEEQSFAFKFICSLFSPIVMIGIAVSVSVINKKSFAKTVTLNKFNYKFAFLSLAIVLSMLLGFGFLNSEISSFIKSIGLNANESEIDINNLGEFIAYSFSIALLPAVSEEFLFRGIMIDNLKGASPFKAVFFVAICFALYHANVSQLFYQLIYGVVFSALALASGSVIPSMIAHFLNNFIILLSLYLKWDIEKLYFNVYCIIVGVVLVVGIMAFLFMQIGKDGGKGDCKIAYKYASFGIALSLLTIVLGLFIK